MESGKELGTFTHLEKSGPPRGARVTSISTGLWRLDERLTVAQTLDWDGEVVETRRSKGALNVSVLPSARHGSLCPLRSSVAP